MTQSKVMLVTVSDDRFGRKDGLYQETQEKINTIFLNNPQFPINLRRKWNWDHIEASEFYKQNKTLLDNKDAGRNGRAYKAFVIADGLSELAPGDFLIYTDCSPEIWDMGEDFKISEKYNIKVLKELCMLNNDILTAFVKWDMVHIPEGELGIHTHENFTMERCINKMGMQAHRKDYMHASGMWVIRKSPKTMDLIQEWVYWNCIDECASLGRAEIEDDESFWKEEEDTKIGHRHDQSISGLLINRIGNKLVEILPENGMHPYNFLQFARTDVDYKFIDSIKPSGEIKPGDIVINAKGTELKVFRIDKENGQDRYIVGRIEASAYGTTRENIRLK